MLRITSGFLIAHLDMMKYQSYLGTSWEKKYIHLLNQVNLKVDIK